MESALNAFFTLLGLLLFLMQMNALPLAAALLPFSLLLRGNTEAGGLIKHQGAPA